ncbi:MAG: LapA family protein [Gammaproteobacteria bacterium]|nr:LapA family protein [Gammaproteobacteria bacterium]
MRIRSLIVVAVLLLVGVFLALNWSAITAVGRFTLLFTSFEAPVGLVMLTIIVLLTATFAGYVILWQATSLLEARRHAKELQAQRQLAEQAESSRLADLRATLQGEFAGLDARIQRLEDGLRSEVRDSGNALAASLAELDDRLQRSGGRT